MYIRIKKWRVFAVAAGVAIIAGAIGPGFLRPALESRSALGAHAPGAGVRDPQDDDAHAFALFNYSLREETASAKAAYRDHPNAENQLRLMAALFSQGAYASVLAIAEDGYASPHETAAFVGEGHLRLHHYDEALAAANLLDETDFGATAAGFIRARVAYANADAANAIAALKPVFRGDRDYLAAAWALRARLALDADEYDIARGAAQRAREAGASGFRVNAIETEILIRSGDLAAARPQVTARRAKTAPRRRNAPAMIDVEGAYLEGLVHIAGGAYLEAQRAFSLAEAWLLHEVNGPLRLAIVNGRADNQARAVDLYAQSLKAAPGNWAAHDAAADFAVSRGAYDDAARHISDLERFNPEAANFRRFLLARARQDDEDAFAAIAAFDAPARTAAGMMFGPFADDTSGLAAFAAYRQLWRGQSDVVAANDEFGARLLLMREVFDGDGAEASLNDQNAAAFHSAALWRAASLMLTGHAKRALTGLNARVEAKTNDVKARLLLARALTVTDEVAQAADALIPVEGALLNSRKDAVFYISVLKHAQMDARLKAFCDRALRQRPRPRAAGAVMEACGRLAEASRIYRASLLGDPTNVDAGAGYSRVMTASNRLNDAKRFLSALDMRVPDAAGVQTALRYLTAGGGESADAIISVNEPAAVLREAYLSAPQNGATLYQLAQAEMENPARAARLTLAACLYGTQTACEAARTRQIASQKIDSR